MLSFHMDSCMDANIQYQPSKQLGNHRSVHQCVSQDTRLHHRGWAPQSFLQAYLSYDNARPRDDAAVTDNTRMRCR